MNDIRSFFRQCYETAIQAAHPHETLRKLLPNPPKGRLIVVGAGKGAAHLAQSFERLYPYPLEGIVVTRYGFGAECARIKIIEASHPVPDKNSAIAAKEILNSVRDLTQDDLVVALITGGGSALLAAPLAPMTLEDEILVNDALLSSGAPIGKMNTLRRHLSQIKGGRLADAAAPAKVLTYLVSDVPGDDPAEVASGPTVAGTTTPEDALNVIQEFNLKLPKPVSQVLDSELANCSKVNSEVQILASAGKSLAAVEDWANKLGLAVINLGGTIEGEARVIASEHAEFVRTKISEGWRGLIISGGETTVTLRGKGKGGRNTEYLLSLAIELDGVENVHMFAADTDGIDGSEDNAGAFADSATVGRLSGVGLNAQKSLEQNDAYSAFWAIGDIFAPGPSGTNVNDLRLILIK